MSCKAEYLDVERVEGKGGGKWESAREMGRLP